VRHCSLLSLPFVSIGIGAPSAQTRPAGDQCTAQDHEQYD
jgi:hypothetical protein